MTLESAHADARAPAEGGVSPALRGLTAEACERSAALVLGRVAWDGLPPDPDVLSAKDFLTLL